MKHKPLAAVLGLFGMLSLSCAAFAQQTASFDITPEIQGDATPPDGDWHVNIQEIGASSQYDVILQSSLTTPPTGPGTEAIVTFNDSNGEKMAITTDSVYLYNVGAGAWQSLAPPGAYNANWAAGPGGDLAINDSNYLFGVVTLTPGIGEVANSVNVVIYDDQPGPWAGTGVLSSEASSLALMLPGLIPMGVVLRKRRQRRNIDSS